MAAVGPGVEVAVKYFNHGAKRDPEDPRLCFICGAEVTGVEPELRHVGEEIRTTPVPREYIDALHECTAIVEQALAVVPTAASDHERARAAVVALIGERYLRAKRGAPPKARARH